MLSITSIANSAGTIGIGNPFVVGAITLLDDQSVELWYTRPATGANTVGNYSVSGPAARSVVLAQYNTTQRVRLYFDSPLIEGQWTLAVSSVQSDDSDTLSIPANTQLVFDVAERQPALDLPVELGTVASCVPKKIRSKRGVAELIEAFQVGDDSVKAQARFAFDQRNICTATGSYLTKKALDYGVVKPEKLAMADEAFSKLAISLVNQRATALSMLRVLKLMFGTKSVHAYVESQAGPFRVFDEGTIEFLIDGKTSLVYVSDTSRFNNSLSVSAQELSSDLNVFFANSNFEAFAEEVDDKVRIYSSTMGLQSKIAVTKGTLQPFLQFNSKAGDHSTAVDVDWEVTNPRPGIVRLQPSTWPYAFTNIRAGDYITIVGENFPLELRGSWTVANTNYSYSGVSLVQWLEIESNYIVGS